jgi:hypothetical protein
MSETVTSVIKSISDLLDNIDNKNYLHTKLILLNINNIITIPKSHINAFLKLFFKQDKFNNFKIPVNFLYINPVCILAQLILYDDKTKLKSISILLNMYNLIPNSYDVDISTYSILIYAYIFGANKKELELIKFIYKKYDDKTLKLKCSWLKNILGNNRYLSVKDPDFLNLKYDKQDNNINYNNEIINYYKLFKNYNIDYNKLRNEIRAKNDLNDEQLFNSYFKTISYLTNNNINNEFIEKYILYNNEIDINLKHILYNYYNKKIKLIDNLFDVKYGDSNFGNLITNLATPLEYFEIIGNKLYNNINDTNFNNDDIIKFRDSNSIKDIVNNFNLLTKL